MTEFWQIIRFGFVGGLATIVHVGVVFLLTHFTQISPVISNTIAFLLAFCVSSLGHLLFTFRVKEAHASRLLKFFCVAVFALTISNIFLASVLAWNILPQYIVQLMAIACVPAITYVASRFWAFAPTR